MQHNPSSLDLIESELNFKSFNSFHPASDFFGYSISWLATNW